MPKSQSPRYDAAFKRRAAEQVLDAPIKSGAFNLVLAEQPTCCKTVGAGNQAVSLGKPDDKINKNICV